MHSRIVPNALFRDQVSLGLLWWARTLRAYEKGRPRIAVLTVPAISSPIIDSQRIKTPCIPNLHEKRLFQQRCIARVVQRQVFPRTTRTMLQCDLKRGKCILSKCSDNASGIRRKRSKPIQTCFNELRSTSNRAKWRSLSFIHHVFSVVDTLCRDNEMAQHVHFRKSGQVHRPPERVLFLPSCWISRIHNKMPRSSGGCVFVLTYFSR